MIDIKKWRDSFFFLSLNQIEIILLAKRSIKCLDNVLMWVIMLQSMPIHIHIYTYYISTSFSLWIPFCMSDNGLSGTVVALFCCCDCWWRWWSFLVTIGRTIARVCGILDCALISVSCPRRVSEAVLDNLTVGFFGVMPAFPVEFRVASPRCNSKALFSLTFHYDSFVIIILPSTVQCFMTSCIASMIINNNKVSIVIQAFYVIMCFRW